MVITFEELRHIKDALPHGSMERIAEELHIEVDAVRNYFGAEHFEAPGKIADVHFEKGISGGVVRLEDTAILQSAMRILDEAKHVQTLN
ncbi:MAG TPA: DNA-binding protein [Chitinophagales bacterium]|nr:DNA-binding protein [Chitinophagales bacterium]HNE44760.1 DNA-binding protein [Chitinophagales bacterium]HNF68606.1 DNA-binding protein [Chitinophagales bacterium]HNI53169.1 DNA-binding protein [Chitinophagales bacterium]HNM07164.1 DNA-binding protein [Chitinophagales bacterium]